MNTAGLHLAVAVVALVAAGLVSVSVAVAQSEASTAAGAAATTPSVDTKPASTSVVPADVAAPIVPPATVRKSLLPYAQPLWSDLKPAQQRVLEPFASQWNSLPNDVKVAWLALADRYPRTSPAEQARTTARIREWARLTPEQRKLARQNYRLAKTLPKDERIAQSQQYSTLTDEQKKVLQTSGSTSNTAARHAGARTALAKEAAQPLTAVPAATSPLRKAPAGSSAPASN